MRQIALMLVLPAALAASACSQTTPPPAQTPTAG